MARIYLHQMRFTKIMKYAILTLVFVILSLKTWAAVSYIANNEHIPTHNEPRNDQIQAPGVGLRKDKLQESSQLSSDISNQTSESPAGSVGQVGVIRVKSSDVEPEGNKQFDDQPKKVVTSTTSLERSAVHVEGVKSKTNTKQFSSGSLAQTREGSPSARTVGGEPSSKNKTEMRHVVFLKVHKCGSSTVQNIFLRFGYFRELTFILGHDDKSKSESGYVNVISYKHTLNENNIVPPPFGRHFDILCCHVIYNRQQFQTYLPSDTAYIGIVREPVKRLESAFGYFGLLKNVDFSEFASKPLQYDRSFPSMANNRMAFEFGFPKECFPSNLRNASFESIQPTIVSYLNNISNDFDFIMINERMDESLVYMKRLLGWHLKDILYVTQNSAKQKRRTFTEEESLQLRNYLYLDYALYDFAVKRFEEAVAKETTDFQEEVKYFKEVNEKVGTHCKSKKTEHLLIDASLWHDKFNITLEDCKYYTLFEMTFIQQIRKQQYGRINN